MFSIGSIISFVMLWEISAIPQVTLRKRRYGVGYCRICNIQLDPNLFCCLQMALRNWKQTILLRIHNNGWWAAEARHFQVILPRFSSLQVLRSACECESDCAFKRDMLCFCVNVACAVLFFIIIYKDQDSCCKTRFV